MQDGRCFTINTASGLLNDYIMKESGIPYADNYAYRQLIQSKGPELLERLVFSKQGGNPGPASANGCFSCNKPLLNVKNIY
jgi:hypothetical protein